jgi:hypothetical protein
MRVFRRARKEYYKATISRRRPTFAWFSEMVGNCDLSRQAPEDDAG